MNVDSLARRATDAVRRDILNWKYRPGQPISEGMLASDLKVSRTPVREALRQLQQEGLVRIVPDRGVFVADIGLRDVVEVFQMREALETAAAALAAQNESRIGIFVALASELRSSPALIRKGAIAKYRELTERLDGEIAIACGNRRIEQALEVLWSHARWLRGSAEQSPERLQASVGEHIAIVEAIVRRDPEAARAAVRRHTNESFQHLMTQLGGLASPAAILAERPVASTGEQKHRSARASRTAVTPDRKVRRKARAIA